MQAIEQLVAARTGQADDGDDAIVVSESFAAVIDGCTRRPHARWQGKRPGQVAVAVLRAAVHMMPPGLELQEALEWMNQQLLELYGNLNAIEALRNSPGERAAATMALYSDARREVWLVGDCQCLIAGQHVDNPMKLDQVLAEVRSLVLDIELMGGATELDLLQHDPGRRFIDPLLTLQARFQNTWLETEFAYAAIDGFPVPPRLCRVIPVPQAVRTVVLASDGYPSLFPTLQMSEEHLAVLLRDDPLCFRRFKATKGLVTGCRSFDDRAYLRIEV